MKADRKKPGQNIDIQFFDADLIATYQHLYFAVLNALQAFDNQTNISNSLAMETMLYASAQRQIQKAIKRCGIKKESQNMAVAIIGGSSQEVKSALQEVTKKVGAEPDEKVLELSERKAQKIAQTFQITDGEIRTVLKNEDNGEALVNLIIERVALLATQL